MVQVLGRNKQVVMATTTCSLELVYDQYHKNVYNYIAFRINNHHDAEELANDVFVKAIRGWDSYDHALAMEGWLIAIAKNIVTDYLRKTMRRKILPFDSILGLISADSQPEEVVVINEESKQLMAAMVKLRDKERQILSMKFATELKHSEIAAILKISESHVAVTAHRAMNKLRKFMEEDAT
ncbi:MAG: sigma-70 family RNA polymerase sigma factor [Defluviitaleaceae bacterium]|nr:sigma-70 family RNA polymerase sigma factor [Defluviitaleaceae bacterium]